MPVQAAKAPITSAEPAGSACRSLYHRTADPEGSFPAEGSVEQIRTALLGLRVPGTGESDLDGLRVRLTTWAADERRRYGALLSEDGEVTDALAGRAALACAPLAAQSGAWLQWLTSPASADDPLALRALALYASDVGVGHPRASLGSAYVAALRRAQLAEYAVPASRLALDRRIADRNFYLPAMLLAMSRLPDDLRPEILGADLCLRTVGVLPPLLVAAKVLWSADGVPGPEGYGGEPRPAEAEGDRGWDAVRAYLRVRGADRERVAAGFGWAWAALARWSDDLHTELRSAEDPAHDMAELLRGRAREGAVYHHGSVLSGRSLSEWLRECGRDPSGFLEALATSDLVRPGRSDRSRLVNGLVMQRGPMFRVFSPGDLAVIRRWIDSLPARAGARTARAPAPPASYPVPRLFASGTPAGRAPADLRSAFHLLQHRRQTPELRRYTHDYIRGWLARSRHGIDRDPRALPRHWPAQGLRPWLLDQHDRHDRDDRDLAAAPGAPLPSREELIDATVQLAPLTLIDGSWLQGFTDYDLASSEHGYFLFETYWDELGNGAPSLNHPLIYREVLTEMGVELPPTASEEFARWPGFRDGSFELPVYWLSIGRYPRTYLPEVLGLNLAMELSGVGGGYRRAHRALERYGFSTRFVDIHNTIDNVATGHSAWAADAVDAFLTSVLGAQGAGAQVKRDAVAKVVLNNLYKHTDLQTNFGANMLALV
ncbi:iron-containing redox enzyme family protein, partial [Streptomyces sp. NPDC001985]|uniref:iron-containing redox enzyme family protein n=1 Tax=Streptomyces sp. NPDC001985 TaxID=3154406 RepID=UPI003323CB0C